VRITEEIRVPSEQLTSFAADVLTAGGLDSREAGVAARWIVYANLRGVDSHGVVRLIQYSDSLAQGEVNPRPAVTEQRGTGPWALIDAGGGYGFAPAIRAAELAAELAADHGLGLVGVRNSHHFGMAASYAERVAELGSIGIVSTNGTRVMAMPGALEVVAGNNPLAIAVPRRPPNRPLISDMAMTASAYGKIRLAAAEGRELPAGWALDSQGLPTTDPVVALAAAMLTPMGGHKGFALAVVLEALTGVLTGSPFGSEASGHLHHGGGNGHLMVAIRTDLFLPRSAFEERLEAMLAEILAAPVREGSAPIRLPGDPELAWLAERRRQGVPISLDLLRQLDELGARLGVGPLRGDA